MTIQTTGTHIIILRLDQVTERTGLSRSFIRALAAKGLFPKPIALTAGRRATVGWIENEVNDWIESRIKASRGSA